MGDSEMGDLEQHEVNMLRRDHQLDWYYDWLNGFEYKAEPRANLLSWLCFEEYCVPCGRSVTVTKLGEHSYEGDCEHLFDRAGVDEATAANAEWRAADEAQWRSQLYDCPVHLVKVVQYDWQRDYKTQDLIITLSCRCEVREPLGRKPCAKCPRLEDGSMRAPRAISAFVPRNSPDPTVTYKLECGHVTIDM